MKAFKILFLLLITGIGVISCSEETKNARLDIRLTDDPGDYEEVNIDIQGVQIHANSTDTGGGWKSLEINPGIYNLLEFTNGLDTLLGSIELPAGRVSQVRLLLGSNNTVKIDGQSVSLTTPSAQQSGLKLNVHTELVEGITYTILLDFDAARSIVKAGHSGKYILKPVIRAITEATSGAIKGQIINPAAIPAVYAIIADDTLGTTFANAEGKFLIKGLQPGIYTVSFAPAAGFVIEDKTGVSVTLGNVTNLGEIPVSNE
ncbi:MAG TPA: DUF4382 domain-containing protein [Cyclobacteriaceae bacterium]|nr:DUF4382 domain-containing protein [Cyclobacteriaceae bacterium]HRJ81044.1 DUF4382 domain-containing protein [Cyclobacteriaceae bacterium]